MIDIYEVLRYFIGHQDVIVLNRKVARFFPNLFRLIQPQSKSHSRPDSD